MYRMTEGAKLQKLLNSPKNIFTTRDLSVLWGVKNSNTLWTTVKRYSASRKLFKLQRGLYSKVTLPSLSDYEIGCALMGPFSYVSLESVLSKEGAVMQAPTKTTLLGEKTKDAKINGHEYTCKKAPTSILLNRSGISEQMGYSVATVERASADLGYFKPKYYLDNTNVIDWYIVEKIRKAIGYK